MVKWVKQNKAAMLMCLNMQALMINLEETSNTKIDIYCMCKILVPVVNTDKY